MGSLDGETQPGPNIRAITSQPCIAAPAQLVVQVRRRLGTTVEEDASRREQAAVLRDRHERAAAEKLQLEHKVRHCGWAPSGSRLVCCTAVRRLGPVARLQASHVTVELLLSRMGGHPAPCLPHPLHPCS